MQTAAADVGPGMHASLARASRIREALEAQRPLAPEDEAAVRIAALAALTNGSSFCGALGLHGGWRTTIKRGERAAAAKAAQRDGERTRSAAKRIRRELVCASSTASIRSARATGIRPPGDLGVKYDLLAANGFKTPSEAAIRNWLA
jgi:hypothetical protein